MSEGLSVGIIGDFDPESPTHKATVESLRHAAGLLDASVEVRWVPTSFFEETPTDVRAGFDALWCAPGTVQSVDGVLREIRLARESKTPFLGTCGGFQHTVIEFARNVLGFARAAHEEYDPDPDFSEHFISALSCSPFGKRMKVGVEAGSRAEISYGARVVEEEYRCNFGISPGRRRLLEAAGLRVSGLDGDGEPRILELPDHPFYMATLFVPQMNSSSEEPHPLIVGLLRAALDSVHTGSPPAPFHCTDPNASFRQA